MVTASAKEILKYTSIEEELKNIKKYESSDFPFSSFFVDRSFSHFFMVLSGSLLLYTSYRENSESSEVLSVTKLEKGRCALLLPGEKFMVREEGDSSISHFVLNGEYDVQY